MKVVIIYASQHGTTKKVAEIIADKLEVAENDLFDIKKTAPSSLDQYDTVLIGGSIHAGRIQGALKKYIEKNKAELMEKQVGLFLCCMEHATEKGKEEFDASYTQEMRDHATAKGLLGGELLLEKMNFLEMAIVKKVAGVTESSSEINYDAIDEFVQKLK